MARTRIEDRGFEALKEAGSDPMASFMLRIIGPGVRQEIGKARERVGRFVDDVTDALLDVEGRPRRKDRGQVIDAEIVEDPKKS